MGKDRLDDGQALKQEGQRLNTDWHGCTDLRTGNGNGKDKGNGIATADPCGMTNKKTGKRDGKM
jgi:hypothetical protein